MRAKLFRILGVIGFIIGIASLSGCFDEPYRPIYPAYGSAYPGYYPPPPRYVPPSYYAYNPHFHHGWEHKEHEEHEWHEHHHHHDLF
jgi:hypothetical protein